MSARQKQRQRWRRLQYTIQNRKKGSYRCINKINMNTIELNAYTSRLKCEKETDQNK